MRPWTRDPVTLAVTTLAAYRVTRLITTDKLPPVVTARRELADRLPETWAFGITCPHCVGFWVSGVAVAACEYAHRSRAGRRAYLLAALPWAISAAVGLLAERELG
jgi:hypothetical protein